MASSLTNRGKKAKKDDAKSKKSGVALDPLSPPSTISETNSADPSRTTEGLSHLFVILPCVGLLSICFEAIQVASIRSASPLFGDVFSAFGVEFMGTALIVLGWVASRILLMRGWNALSAIRFWSGIIVIALACASYARDFVAKQSLQLPENWSMALTGAPTLSPFLQGQISHGFCLYPIAFSLGVVLGALVQTSHIEGASRENAVALARTMIPLTWFGGSRAAGTLINAADLYFDRSWNPHRFLAATALGFPAFLFFPISPLSCKPSFIVALGVLIATISFFTNSHLQTHETSIQIHPEYTLMAKSHHVQVLFDHGRDALMLRQGHSLLGGVYRSSGDSIFAGFYLHDMHALISSRSTPVKRVLLVGYGVGIAASSWTHANISVDVVDIDYNVIQLARNHFPVLFTANKEINQFSGVNGRRADNGNIHFHVADGKEFLDASPEQTYDVIIHDVFTGGAILPQLVGPDVIRSAKRAMTAQGTLSLNWVASQNDSQSLGMIGQVLKNSFPSVRCFQEDLQGATEDVPANYVFFAGENLQFRPAERPDALGSVMRWHSLTHFHERTFPSNVTFQENRLIEATTPMATSHFNIMRTLIPLEVWLKY
jgi:hypothetical protein